MNIEDMRADLQGAERSHEQARQARQAAEGKVHRTAVAVELGEATTNEVKAARTTLDEAQAAEAEAARTAEIKRDALRIATERHEAKIREEQERAKAEAKDRAMSAIRAQVTKADRALEAAAEETRVLHELVQAGLATGLTLPDNITFGPLQPREITGANHLTIWQERMRSAGLYA